MQKLVIYLLFLLFPGQNYNLSQEESNKPDNDNVKTNVHTQLFQEMQLEGIVDFDLFEKALIGYEKIDNIKNKNIITLIDFRKPSTEKRLYVLDIKDKRLLFSSLVSHGKNSGDNYATSFSNKNGSNKSSLGFFITENTYQGRNGYSLILNGIEKGINDNAKERAIVIHGAPYCNPSVIASGGRLGRSLGCPALPQSLSKTIINTIKDGTLLFIYANDQNYFAHSNIIPNSINYNKVRSI